MLGDVLFKLRGFGRLPTELRSDRRPRHEMRLCRTLHGEYSSNKACRWIQGRRGRAKLRWSDISDLVYVYQEFVQLWFVMNCGEITRLYD